jgi:hypothetical protein
MTGKDPRYIHALHNLPCVICDRYGEEQKSHTQAHHCIHGRGSFRKVPDRQSIPLCEGHHQGNFDTSKVALHRQPTRWKRLYGEDTQYIAATLDMVEMMEVSNG